MKLNDVYVLLFKTAADPGHSEQMTAGIEVEKEHIPTFKKIEKYLKDNGKMPDNKTMQSWIATDHLDEFDNYYLPYLRDMETKLKSLKKTAEGMFGEKNEGNVLPPAIQQQIINFVKTRPNLDDTEFHNFVMSLGIDPHEAEEVVYKELKKSAAVKLPDKVLALLENAKHPVRYAKALRNQHRHLGVNPISKITGKSNFGKNVAKNSDKLKGLSVSDMATPGQLAVAKRG